MKNNINFQKGSLARNLTGFLLIISLLSPSLSAVVYADTSPINPNLFQNYNLELTTISSTTPDTFVTGGWGTNDRVFSYPVEGPLGVSDKAVSISVTNYTDGDAKWIPQVVSVTPGKEYVFKDEFKSDAVTQIIGEFCTDSSCSNVASTTFAGWIEFAPATTTWGTATANFTVPAGVNYMTVFHALHSVGTLTVDNFSLTEVSAVVPDPVVIDPLNLISNPQFTLNPTPTAFPVPLGWYFESKGINNATSTYPAVGPNATTTALKVDITSYTDGGAVWFGGFSPVTALAQYQYNELYNSNAGGFLEAEFIVENGQNVYINIADLETTNGTWETASTTFNAVPYAKFVRVYHVLNKAGSLSIASPRLINSGSPSPFDKAMVTLSFDDGNQSEYDVALPILKASSFPSTFYIVTNPIIVAETVGTTTSVDTSNNYMTREEVLSIARAGNEIGNHTVFHCNLGTGLCPDGEPSYVADSLTPTQEIDQAHATLLDVTGIQPPTLAYPYGGYNQNVKDILNSRNYIAARSVDPGYNLKNSDRYALKIQQVIASTTLATSADYFNVVLKPRLDTAIANKLWLILSFHGVEVYDPNGFHNPYSTTPEVLQMVIDYLKANSDKVSVVSTKTGACLLNSNMGNPKCSEAEIPVSNSTITFTTQSPLVNAVINKPYSQFILAKSSKTFEKTLHWSVVSGSLPNGLFINPSNGNIFGTTTTIGTKTFTVKVTNIDGSVSATKDYSLTVGTKASKTTPPVSTTTPPCVYKCGKGKNSVGSRGIHHGDEKDNTSPSFGNNTSPCWSNCYSEGHEENYGNNNHWGSNNGSHNEGHYGNDDDDHDDDNYGGHDGGHGGHNGGGGGNLDDLTIVATKIVCDNERDLPNWGLGGPDITENTALDYVHSHPSCHITPNWKFQWSFDNEIGKLPAPVLNGDFIGEASSPLGYSLWNTFSGDENGGAKTKINNLNGATKIWVREVLKDGYIPFTYPQNPNNNNVSAEMYCNNDVLNYDNYDFINNVKFGNTYYCVAFNAKKLTNPEVNTPPVITLIGNNPIEVVVGDTYTDAGAKANDLEDGSITSDIVKTGVVDTSIVGTYTIKYNVKDSGGLSASEVVRIVNVVPRSASNSGKITFCLVLANDQNVIATSSSSLPSGVFSMSLSTSTGFSTTTLNLKTWSSQSFVPNQKTILSENDSDCVVYSNLSYGEYNYSTLNINGTSWSPALYNDGDTNPVNNVFDFGSYSTSTSNSDGVVMLGEMRAERKVVVYSTYKNISNPTTTPPSNGGGGSVPNANLKVIKTADKTTASTTEQIIYSINVENLGPDKATSTVVSDILPAQLEFVSASSSAGSYASSTGIWTIGELLNGSSITLQITTKVKDGTEGQTIINTATTSSTVSDSDTTNNISISTITVNSIPTTTPPNNGGGGSGGGTPPPSGGGGGGVPSNGPIVGSYGGGGGGITPVFVNIPSSGGSCNYLLDYLRSDFKNNPVEVKKLQVFLKDIEGFANLKVTGVYDKDTVDAVNIFQIKYKDDILTPWGHTGPTGYTYILTKKKVNEIYCRSVFPLTNDQQNEIDIHRNLLNKFGVSLGVVGFNTNQAKILNSTTTKQFKKDNKSEENVSNVANVGMTTLAGLSSTTEGITSQFTANVISSGKKLANLVFAIFSWPFKNLFTKSVVNECSEKVSLYGWSNILLILVIIIISYLWYKEYRSNKKIEEINKEIDLQ